MFITFMHLRTFKRVAHLQYNLGQTETDFVSFGQLRPKPKLII